MATESPVIQAPNVELPRDFNFAAELIERNLAAGRGGKVAFVDDRGSYTYGDLASRVGRAANALRGLGIEPEQRILLCLVDTIDFPTMFLGAIKAGIVPVPVNTLLTAGDYLHMLRDSRARAAIVSDNLVDRFAPVADQVPTLRHLLVSGGAGDGLAKGWRPLDAILAAAAPDAATAPTTRDDICFWLYTSGSTGTPKGVVHLHSHPVMTAELYGKGVLGIAESDVVFSAAKLFFAYGLGNALTFPLTVGATSVLMAERPTAASVSRMLRVHRPSFFYGVPTLYGMLLASPDLPRRDEMALRRCVSAGEALPEEIGRRWAQHFGVDILDGLGSTEMLQTFLSNRPGEVRYGTTGKPVPGYALRLVGDDGREVGTGEIGELQINGPSSAAFYWNNREGSRNTFLGPWTRSGDKYLRDTDGYYTYCGRSDDMLKVGGIYVSPFEVEGALIAHDAVLEAAVVGELDERRLVKPKAFVVLKQGYAPSLELAQELQDHVRTRLAPFKFPRWIEFLPELPKTATGKIQRFKLRSPAVR
jgi:benzoate-CoA ligase